MATKWVYPSNFVDLETGDRALVQHPTGYTPNGYAIVRWVECQLVVDHGNSTFSAGVWARLPSGGLLTIDTCRQIKVRPKALREAERK